MNTRASSPQEGQPFLGLNRPQYANMPEILISSLVWSLLERLPREDKLSLVLEEDGEVFEAVAFDSHGHGASSVKIGYTKPAAPRERWERLVEVIAETFDLRDNDAEDAAQLLVNDLRALRPTKSKSFAAIPLDTSAALLQDRSGLLRTRGPANYAAIFERMFALGGGKGSPARLLVTALQGEGNGHPGWLSSSLSAMSPRYVSTATQMLAKLDDEQIALGGEPPRWIEGVRTPYAWFAESWSNLCEGGWIERMPRRRWVDWASCALRTTLGMGFLFEMNLVRKMVLAVTTDEGPDAVAQAALGDGAALMRWDDSARVSDRNVREQIRNAAYEGTAAMDLLRRWISKEGCPSTSVFQEDENGLENWLNEARSWARARGTAHVLRELAAAMEGAIDSRSANNVDETIFYALRERSEGPGANDLYAMLKQRGRYFVVDPGQEWLVAISALAGDRSARVTRAADVEGQLMHLRLQPGLPAIIRRLEASGLARGSHDADGAVEVQIAF